MARQNDIEHKRKQDLNQEQRPASGRRRLLGLGSVLAGAAMLPAFLPTAAQAAKSASGGGRGFPRGFLWGAAIAGHQAEGDNVASDAWLLENIKPTNFKEPSGAAVDHYRLYDQDIGMLAGVGLNTF